MKKSIISNAAESLIIIENKSKVVLPFSSIIKFVFDKPYVKIYTKNNKCMLVFNSIKNIASLLPENFVQTDKSTLINLSYAISINKTNNLINIKINEDIHKISRRKYRTVSQKFTIIKSITP